MSSKSATLLVVFVIAVGAFCIASVFAAMTGEINILPNETDLMYDIKTASLKSQGFTGGQGITPSLLNTERVWQDKGAPNFGAGPNF